MAFIIIFILILLNAYFSLAEIALVAVKQGQLAAEEEKGNKAAEKALRLVKDPESFLSAVQVGITLLGLLEGIYGGDLVASRLVPLLSKWGMSAAVAHALSLILGIGLITYLTIVIGELVPKSIALQAPLKVSLAIASSLAIFSRIAYPFIRVLTWTTRLLLQWFNIKTNEEERISEQDVKRMLSTAYQQGILEKEELWLHQNVFAFGELTARRMMKPLSITRCIADDWNSQQIEDTMRKYPYSHFPVYHENISSITGVLSMKAFFLERSPQWQERIDKVLTVPEDMEATDIFTLLKDKRSDFALVVNGTQVPVGILTMQDIMEGVFGDIPELENYSAYFFKVSDKVWQAHGLIHVQRIRRVLGLDWLRKYEEDYINVAELMEGELKHPPSENDTLILHDVVFRVITAGHDSALTVTITLPGKQ